MFWLTRQHICKMMLLNSAHLKEFSACVNLKFGVPALSSLILSSAVLTDIFNSRIIEPQKIRSYCPENLLITLCKFLIKGMDKRDDLFGNRFQREFLFQNFFRKQMWQKK